MPGVVTALHGEEATVALLFLGQLRSVILPLEALEHREAGS